MACVEGIVNGHGHVNYGAIPGVVYTHPEGMSGFTWNIMPVPAELIPAG